MKRLAWATDIHLNFVDAAGFERFCDELLAPEPDVVLVAGDIAEAPSIEDALVSLEEALQRPIYFVLGNHDSYRGSIADVRQRVAALCRQSRHLHWMNDETVVPLGPATALVGHDGWGDGRLGNGTESRVVLNDFLLIDELSAVWPDARELLAALGDQAMRHFARVVPLALRTHEQVIVLTHVPPFREACWHEGNVSDDEWLPYFTCDAAGRALEAAMRAAPRRSMTVLCGHTHSAGAVQILPNLSVVTGGADYGRPAVQGVMEIR